MAGSGQIETIEAAPLPRTVYHHVDDGRARGDALRHLDMVLVVGLERDFCLCVCHAVEGRGCTAHHMHPQRSVVRTPPATPFPL